MLAEIPGDFWRKWGLREGGTSARCKVAIPHWKEIPPPKCDVAENKHDSEWDQTGRLGGGARAA